MLFLSLFPLFLRLFVFVPLISPSLSLLRVFVSLPLISTSLSLPYFFVSVFASLFLRLVRSVPLISPSLSVPHISPCDRPQPSSWCRLTVWKVERRRFPPTTPSAPFGEIRASPPSSSPRPRTRTSRSSATRSKGERLPVPRRSNGESLFARLSLKLLDGFHVFFPSISYSLLSI